MKKFGLIAILLAFGFLLPTFAQYPTDYFRHPLTLPVSMAGDFAEIRPNHFHGGIDLRTDGKTGQKVYAPADGYVSRINISAWGGGKILYITHPNGFRTVYMHLDAFCGEIGKFVHDYQYKHHVFAFNIELPKDSIRVKKGDVVALTGNTGGSSGPHLHYEIRYAHNDQAINPLYFGIKYTDPVSPTIDDIKIYPANGRTSINGSNRELKLLKGTTSNTVKITKGKHKGKRKTVSTKKNSDTVTIAGRFYTGIYAYDQMEVGSRNKNGVEKIELYVDGQLFHRYHVPTFMFEETRAINAIIDYPEYQRSLQYYVITRHLRGDNNTFSTPFRDNGFLEFSDEETHTLEYRVSDLKGNVTKRRFYVQSKPDALLPEGGQTILASGEPIIYFKRFSFTREGFQAILQPNTIYENDEIIYSSGKDAAGLSPLHRFNLKNHPLPPHQNFTVRLAVPQKVPAPLRSKLVVVCLNGKSCKACSTKLEDSMLTATTRSFGSFAVRLDTVPPSITPSNFKEGKNAPTTLTVKIGDNLSGVDSYHCYINGQWTLAEHDGKTATLNVSAAGMTKGRNEVLFRVKDAVGNETTITCNVIKP